MQVNKTKLDGVLEVVQPTLFQDHRGQYTALYIRRLYQQAGIEAEFVEDCISVSRRHVLRGIHGDNLTWKLISCLYGQFYLVVLNLEANSPQYGMWESWLMDSHSPYRQILVPPNFGNGHLVLSDEAIFHYRQSSYYNPEGQFTIKWNDPRFNIEWPNIGQNPITSERDTGCES